MKVRTATLVSFSLASLVSAYGRPASYTFSDDPSSWTGRDVYRILNQSPWTQSVKVNFSRNDSGGLADQGPGAGSANNAPPPIASGAGGIGRRGRPTATYSSGGSGRPSAAGKSGPTEVKIQWQSAPIVQIAMAKKNGDTVDAASIQPLDEYIIAVIGLPLTALGGRAASTDSEATINSDMEQRIQQHVLSSCSIARSGHNALKPTKVELDQGSDGRMLIHFPKKEAIGEEEKSVELRLAIGHAEIKKRFALKDLEFRGKLSL